MTVKLFITRHISWLPLLVLIAVVLVSVIYRKQNITVPPSNELYRDINCHSICEGFMGCLIEVADEAALQKRNIQAEQFQSACYSGCQKQKHLMSKCEKLIIEKKCWEATLCLQNAMQGK